MNSGRAFAENRMCGGEKSVTIKKDYVAEEELR